MARSLKVCDDPRLDRAFTEAYYATMREVERAEKRHATADTTDAFASMFLEELERRDLRPEERLELVRTLRRNIGVFRSRAEERPRRRRRAAAAAGGGVALLAVLVFLGYLASARPFASIPAVERELASYRERVVEGYGEYSKRYYRIVDRYDRRLGAPRVAELRSSIHEVLDSRFEEMLGKVESGEIALVDDALRWSGYYADREERKERRSQVQNATIGAVGKRVGESVESLLDGARDLVDRVTGSVEPQAGGAVERESR